MISHEKNRGFAGDISIEVLVQPRLRAQLTGLRVCGNVDEKVVNTLIRLRSSGLSEGTLRNLAFNLKHLAKFSDLDCPESAKDCISRKDCAHSFKENLSKAYNYYAVAKGLEWIKPKYRFDKKLPRIPTTEALENIISSASPRYATILRVLMETGVSAR